MYNASNASSNLQHSTLTCASRRPDLYLFCPAALEFQFSLTTVLIKSYFGLGNIFHIGCLQVETETIYSFIS